MSDFYGCLLSTRFRVRDREKFLADPEVQDFERHARTNDGVFDEEDGYFFFGWSGQYPSVVITPYEYLVGLDDKWDEEKEEVELDITGVIEKHILPGDLCQVGISGHEKLWNNGGPLFWVTSKGTVSLNIYTQTDVIITEDKLLAQAERFLADINQTFKTNARPEAT